MRLIGNRHGEPLTLLTEADRQQRFADAVEGTRRREYDPINGEEILPEPTSGEQARAWEIEASRPRSSEGDKRDPFSDDEHLGFQPV